MFHSKRLPLDVKQGKRNKKRWMEMKKSVNKPERDVMLYLFRHQGEIKKSAYVVMKADPKRTANTSRDLATIKKMCDSGHLIKTQDGYKVSDAVMKIIKGFENYEFLNKSGFLEQVIDILFPSKKMGKKEQEEKIMRLLDEHLKGGTAMNMMTKGFFGSELAHQVVNEKLIEKADEKLERNIRK